MANAVRKKDHIPFNADVLKWAREWRGRSIDDVASKLKQPAAKILEWEDKGNDSVPTVSQARVLADLYERSFLEFLRPSPPKVAEPKLVPDLRRPRDAKKLNAEQERDLKSIQMWAEAQRENALDLYGEIGETPPELPRELHTSTSKNIDVVADRVREALHFDISEQVGLKSKDKYRLPSILRKKFAGAGILTFKRSELKKLGIRGICIFADQLPVIIFGNESPAAQAFTLSHELAHVALGESGIIGPVRKNSSSTEKWCDQFAASFLMPKGAVRDVAGPMPNVPAQKVTDDELLKYSRHFSVSAQAMLIRLVHLGYVREDFYWNVKKSKFDTDEANFKQFGRGEYYGTRYRNTMGDLYTGLVLEAWNADRITNHNAAEFMGIKNISHLYDIRENFGSS
jgi:Zn-dependent peptidase ImmA (M78 family)